MGFSAKFRKYANSCWRFHRYSNFNFLRLLNLSGGVAAGISQFLRDKNIFTPQRDFGIPEKFLNHGTRAQVMAEIGLTAQEISREIIEAVARLDNALSERKN